VLAGPGQPHASSEPQGCFGSAQPAGAGAVDEVTALLLGALLLDTALLLGALLLVIALLLGAALLVTAVLLTEVLGDGVWLWLGRR
jgi:hypothetical protein